jgi:cytochrome P450
MKISLHVITAAGYGYPLDWESSREMAAGHQMSFHDSIHVTLDRIITIVAIPRLLFGLPIKHLKDTKRAYDEVGLYLQNLIDLGKQTRDNNSNEGENILSNLVAHSANIWKGPKEHSLSDDEIIGNAFLFLLAGHETTYILIIT